MNEKRMDVERATFEAWYAGYSYVSVDRVKSWREGYSYSKWYTGALGAWVGWQARASLPVGVPDRWRRVVYQAEECLAGCLAAPDIARNLDADTVRKIIANLQAARFAMLAAQTVKAEHWKCEQCGAGTGEACNANGCFANERSADEVPSLPAAGSAGEEAPEQWCDKDHLVSILADVIGRERMSRDRLPDRLFAEVIYKAISEHLPIYEDVYDQCSSIIEPYVARPHRPDGMLPGSVVDSLRLLLQHRLAALSAQQPAPDAPERVSVAVELLGRIVEATPGAWWSNDLRAILGRRGRGEA